MSMNNFKKISSDKDKTVMQHKDGHQITIAHKGISPKYRAQLAALPEHKDKMADGGVVADSSNQSAAMKENTSKSKKKDLEVEELNPVEPKNPLDYEAMAHGGEVKQSNPKLEESKKLPHYADGGAIEDAMKSGAPVTINIGHPGPPPSNMPTPVQNATPAEQPFDVGNLGPNINSSTPQAPINTSNQIPEQPQQVQPQQIQQPQLQPNQSTAPQSVASQQPSGTQQNQDAFGTALTQGTFQKGVEQQIGGTQRTASAEAALGKEQAGAEQEAAGRNQELQDTYKTSYDAIQGERDSLQHDIANFHIDPKRYIDNMSTGSRIATGIGMILGGMGASVTGGRNLVVDQFQHMIDQDIDAQKAELGKKENLLSVNFKREGNLRDALATTRIMSNDILVNQLATAAANAKGPLAKAQATAAIGQINQSTAQMQGQYAARKALLGSGNAALVNAKPEMIARSISALVPKEEQPAAFKEYQELQATASARDKVLQAMDKVAQINTVGNRALNPLQSKRQIDAITGPMVAGLSKETAGRFTEQDAGMLAPLFKTLGDNPQTLAVKKQEAMDLFAPKLQSSVLEGYGIPISKMARFNSGSSFQHPADQVKTVNGVKYTRGPNGEAIRVK